MTGSACCANCRNRRRNEKDRMNLFWQKHRAATLTPEEREALVRRWEETAAAEEERRADICHAHADRQSGDSSYSRH